MDQTSISLFVAFSAGLLSFLSPCVLPLVPSYLGFITGLGLEDITRARRTTLVHALLFVVGFSAVFVVLGAGATLLGQLLLAYKVLIARIGGIMLIALGLWMLGVFKFAVLNQERRVHLTDKPLGYLGTLMVGVAFGAGWTPCLGPILSGILMIAGSESTVGRGVALLAAYSAGLAVPFSAKCGIAGAVLWILPEISRASRIGQSDCRRSAHCSRSAAAERLVSGTRWLARQNHAGRVARTVVKLSPRCCIQSSATAARAATQRSHSDVQSPPAIPDAAAVSHIVLASTASPRVVPARQSLRRPAPYLVGVAHGADAV